MAELLRLADSPSWIAIAVPSTAPRKIVATEVAGQFSPVAPLES